MFDKNNEFTVTKDHIEILNISKYYPSAEEHTVALDKITFNVSRGDIFGIIGHSGAGKSTLLRSINRLEEISSGQILIDGIDIRNISYEELLVLRKKIGMIFQHFNLLGSRSVLSNVEFPLVSSGVPRKIARVKAMELLTRVGLSDKANAKPSQLSGGQKQRVGIARALAHSPEILLCDEATSALDPETTQSILELLKELNKELGLTIVLITHDMNVIKKICNRLIVLHKGKIVDSGNTWQMFGEPTSQETKNLLSPIQNNMISGLNSFQKDISDGVNHKAILKISFLKNKENAGIPLQLISLIGPDIEIVQSNVETLDNHTIGNVFISTKDVFDLDVIRKKAQSLDIKINIEVEGYVTYHA